MQLDAIFLWIVKENESVNTTCTNLRNKREQSWEQWKQDSGKSDEKFTSLVKDNYLYELSTPARLDSLTSSATTDKFVLMCCGGIRESCAGVPVVTGALREVVRVRCHGDEGALELASRALAICTEVASAPLNAASRQCVLGLSNYWE